MKKLNSCPSCGQVEIDKKTGQSQPPLECRQTMEQDKKWGINKSTGQWKYLG